MAASNGPLKKRLKLDNEDTITILVGYSETKFIVHEDVIKSCSEFFNAACAGGFKEAKEKVVRLPDIQPETFGIYAHWIYTKSLVLLDPDAVAQDVEGQERIMVAVEVFVAGDVLGDRPVRNAAIDCILRTRDETSVFPDPDIVSFAYDHSPENSNLRRVMIDIYLEHGKAFAGWFKRHADEFPRQFLVDILHGRLLNNHVKPAMPKFSDRCKYHEHDDSEPKCSRY